MTILGAALEVLHPSRRSGSVPTRPGESAYVFLAVAARRSSRRAAHQVRAGHQPQDRQCARADDPADAAAAGGPGDRIARARPTRPAPPDVECRCRRVVWIRPLPRGMRHREHASARPGLYAVGEVQFDIRYARTGRSRRSDHVQVHHRRGPGRDRAMLRRSRPWPPLPEPAGLRPPGGP
jgi:hypothetical protein